MEHRVWRWIAATFLLATVLDAHAVPLDAGDVDIHIVSDERGPLTEYPVVDRPHLQRAYIAALPDERYRIRVTNRSNRRIGLVIAVDGRNILNGRRSELAPDEAMYVLGPHESAEYAGWRTARDRVARFYFTDAAHAYAEAWGDRSAMGVIAVAIFREKAYKPPAYRPHRPPEARRRGFLGRPGTGFGEETSSPSRRVHFEPRRHPDLRVFLKYEWRETLCRRGILPCGDHRARNRFWPDDDDGDFAPYPWELN